MDISILMVIMIINNPSNNLEHSSIQYPNCLLAWGCHRSLRSNIASL